MCSFSCTEHLWSLLYSYCYAWKLPRMSCVLSTNKPLVSNFLFLVSPMPPEGSYFVWLLQKTFLLDGNGVFCQCFKMMSGWINETKFHPPKTLDFIQSHCFPSKLLLADAKIKYLRFLCFTWEKNEHFHLLSPLLPSKHSPLSCLSSFSMCVVLLCGRLCFSSLSLLLTFIITHCNYIIIVYNSYY